MTFQTHWTTYLSTCQVEWLTFKHGLLLLKIREVILLILLLWGCHIAKLPDYECEWLYWYWNQVEILCFIVPIRWRRRILHGLWNSVFHGVNIGKYFLLYEILVDLPSFIIKLLLYTDWCLLVMMIIGTSKNLGSLWEDLGKAIEGEDEIEIGEVDCATGKAVCTKVDIHSYPTFKVFYDGEEVAKYQGKTHYLIAVVQ